MKTGVNRQTGIIDSIKVIVKRKYDKPVLLEKIASIQRVKAFVVTSKSKKNETIAKIREVIDTDKKLYVCCEMVEGTQLQKKVLIEGRLRAAELLDLLIQVRVLVHF